MNTNSTTGTLSVNHSSGHQPSSAPAHRVSGHGARQPPRNMVVHRPDTVVMLTYSASMNSANFSDEYSVWKPPTSSDSASGRSNGARLVSPTAATRYSRKLGSSRPMYQMPDCAATIRDVDMEPAVRNTATTDRPMATS